MANFFRRVMYILGFGREDAPESEAEYMDGETGGPAVKVVVFKPNNFNDTKNMAVHIQEGRSVLVNLEELSHGVSQRIVDYMCGATYSVEGEMQKIGEYIFFFAPPGINIGMDGFFPQYKSDPFSFDDLGI
jgi:FtsZ-interacting cell division protein YlmF